MSRALPYRSGSSSVKNRSEKLRDREDVIANTLAACAPGMIARPR